LVLAGGTGLAVPTDDRSWTRRGGEDPDPIKQNDGAQSGNQCCDLVDHYITYAYSRGVRLRRSFEYRRATPLSPSRHAARCCLPRPVPLRLTCCSPSRGAGRTASTPVLARRLPPAARRTCRCASRSSRWQRAPPPPAASWPAAPLASPRCSMLTLRLRASNPSPPASPGPAPRGAVRCSDECRATSMLSM
jgi:hypothetical protein